VSKRNPVESNSPFGVFGNYLSIADATVALIGAKHIALCRGTAQLDQYLESFTSQHGADACFSACYEDPIFWGTTLDNPWAFVSSYAVGKKNDEAARVIGIFIASGWKPTKDCLAVVAKSKRYRTLLSAGKLSALSNQLISDHYSTVGWAYVSGADLPCIGPHSLGWLANYTNICDHYKIMLASKLAQLKIWVSAAEEKFGKVQRRLPVLSWDGSSEVQRAGGNVDRPD
jgi:hypothetical protein